MTDEEIIRLADWLIDMQNNFIFKGLEGDPVVKEHVAFLKKAEVWLRARIAQG